MKHIKRFNEFILNELYVHKNSDELNDKKFLLYKENLWIFDEDEWIDLYEDINKALGKDILTDDYDDSMTTIREEYFYILIGYISNDVIYLEGSGDFRESEHSPDLFKLKKELNLPIRINYDDHGSIYQNTLNVNVFKEKLENRKFYHGTSLNFLRSILKTGLKPNEDVTNYEFVNHRDKIFFTLNKEKALFHAINAARYNKSFPIIIEFKVPDVSKLVIDYDLAVQIYGSKSDIVKNLDYDRFTKIKSDNKGYLKDITNKIGVFGYKGRIPVSHITDIHIDLHVYNDYQDIFNPEYGEYDEQTEAWNEMSNVDMWSEVSKNEIFKRLEDIESYFEDEFREDDEYQEDDE